MKIFTIPSWYKTKNKKETCIFIYEQMQSLKRIGHEIIVLSVQTERKLNRKKIECVNDNGILTYYCNSLGIWPSKLRFNCIHYYKKSLDNLFLEAVSQNGLPDVIYAHFSYPAGYVALQLGKKYNVPVVIQEHYSGLMSKKIDFELKRILNTCVLNSKKFICVSSGLKNCIVSHVGNDEKIFVISNMINSCFKYEKIQYIRGENFIFCSIGSLIKRKGFDILIKAFSDEFIKEKNVKLYIAGSGEEKEKLEGLIKERNMQDNIFLLGQLSREKTIELYKKSHCFVLASKAETYGLVYREALATGRPIISTNHGGFTTEDWHDEYGKLIDINSITQLKQAMRELYQNYNKYDGKIISKLCLNDCSEKVVINKIDCVLRESTK